MLAGVESDVRGNATGGGGDMCSSKGLNRVRELSNMGGQSLFHSLQRKLLMSLLKKIFPVFKSL